MIVAGFGFRAAVQEKSLDEVLRLAASRQKVDCLATVDDKARTAAFAKFAARRGLPVVEINAGPLRAQQTPTQSRASISARQTGSVAEAAALAAAGQGARLIVPRVISEDGRATCALAEGEGI